jgi:hypothetical protein
MVTKEIKKNFSNSKGGIFIYLIIVIVVFLGLSALVLDFSNVYIKSAKIKYAVNRAVKASTIQVLEGEELANGNFLIDEVVAQDTFERILAHNLGLDENTLEPLEKSLLTEKPTIKEFVVENNTPTIYNSPTLGRAYPIDNPSVIAVLEFKIRGVLIKKTLRISKLSSSQLTSIYP